MNRIKNITGGSKKEEEEEIYGAVQETRTISNAITDISKQMETGKERKREKAQTTGKGLPTSTKRKTGGKQWNGET